MSDLNLTKTKMTHGTWHGILSGAGTEQPQIAVTFENAAVDGVDLSHDADQDHWTISIPIPAEAIGDGTHVVLINDAVTGDTLDKITLIAGEALGDDIRAEMELLRAELDMLKRAFRRHCRET